MSKMIDNVPPDGFACAILAGSQPDSRRTPDIRAHRRGAHRLSLAVLLVVCGLLVAWLSPRALLGANPPAVPQPAGPSRQSTNQGTTNVSAPTASRAIPKPSLGTLERYPIAFLRPAPASIDDLKTIEAHVKSLVGRVSLAVVSVTVGGAGGSAVVISADGLVLCAAHVCGEPNRDVLFTFPDGKTAKGKTLGTNQEMDSGLMKITDPGPWPHAPVGDLDRARLGNWVLALGHPGGFDPQRPTVARLGRIIVLTPALLQTDCTLLGGDSGGPLFDMSGRVIGIHSRISESTEENFHVPITTFLATWDRLAAGENWGGPTPYVGIWGVDAPEGFLLQSIDTNSPASRAGLRAGDIVTKFNGQQIKDVFSYEQSLRRIRPGTEVELQFKRDGKPMSLRVTVEGRGSWRGRGRFGGP